MKFDLAKLTFVEIEKCPEKLAVAASDGDLTWVRLRAEVGNTITKLKELQIPKGHPVIIYGHKEKFFVVSIIACMCLGLPYVPIDIIYPPDRVEQIKQQLKSGILIICKNQEIFIFSEYCSTSLWREQDPIIYIIFTSGSTGSPKGVQITQNALMDFSRWLIADFGFHENSVFMNQAPFSFDLSVYELIAYLILGATIVLNPKEVLENYDQFKSRLQSYQCTVWISTPSFIKRFLLAKDFDHSHFPALTTFLFCGETLIPRTAQAILDRFETATLFNSYGPTEATVATTLVKITRDLLSKYPSSLPVGYPKSTTEIRLINPLEENGKIVGEIELIGDNVSIGYFKNDTLNHEKFTFEQGKRCFKTGDYGYFEESLLFLVGRKDDLVKLHGYRIEIGEIDKIIENHKFVSQSVTVPLKRGTEVVKLVSFVQLNQSSANNNEVIETINRYLAERLPYYMLPSSILICDKYPYNR